MGYALKLAGAAIAILSSRRARDRDLRQRSGLSVGIGAAIVVVCGGLLLFAWNVDRKDKAKRAGIDELPRV